MTFHSKVLITWHTPLPASYAETLEQLQCLLAANQHFLPMAPSSIGSGIYSQEGEFMLVRLLSSQSVFYSSIDHISAEGVDINLYVSELTDFAVDPRAVVFDALDNHQLAERLNPNPYWSDIYNFSKGQFDKLHDPSYKDIIDTTQDTDQYNKTVTYINDSIDKFGVFKDERDIMKIVQIELTPQHEQTIFDQLPNFIKEQNIRLTVQNMESGTFTQIHRDHDRSCHMFYLLSNPDVETKWYLLKPEHRAWALEYNIGSFGPVQVIEQISKTLQLNTCLLYTSPSPRD